MRVKTFLHPEICQETQRRDFICTHTPFLPFIHTSPFSKLTPLFPNQKSLLLQAALTIPAQLHTTELAVLTANALQVNARNLVLYSACNPIEAPWSLIRATAWDCTALTMAEEMRRHVDADYFAVRRQLMIFLRGWGGKGLGRGMKGDEGKGKEIGEKGVRGEKLWKEKRSQLPK
jgi:hypothetical protein